MRIDKTRTKDTIVMFYQQRIYRIVRNDIVDKTLIIYNEYCMGKGWFGQGINILGRQEAHHSKVHNSVILAHPHKL